MQNWRYSYDSQKSKLLAPGRKINGFPTFLQKSAGQKSRNKKITDNLGSPKKTNSYRISPIKSLQVSKAHRRQKNQQITPPKTPKSKILRQNKSESAQQPKLAQHKSSIITDDSQSNQNKQKLDKINRFKTQCFQSDQNPTLNIKKIKREKIKTQTSSPIEIMSPEVNLQKASRIQKQQSHQNIIKLPIKQIVSIQDFVFLNELGRGFNSVVFLARHKTMGILFAIKILLKQYIKSQSLKQNIFREMKIHSFIKHPNALNLYTILDDQKFIYLILQYAAHGTLYSTLKKQKSFSQQKTSKIIKDICRGVKYLHDNNIIHRDLKLQNILMTQGVAKIGDFGCAVYGYCMRKSKIGSPAYLSPEQLHQNFYGKKIDIWSIGIMTYEMLFQSTPFDKQITQVLIKGETYVEMKVKFPHEAKISDQARSFITKCLQRKQHERMDIDQVWNHPFLQLQNKSKQFLIKP